MYYVPFVTMATVEFWSVCALSSVLALLPRYVSFSPFCIYFKDVLSMLEQWKINSYTFAVYKKLVL